MGIPLRMILAAAVLAVTAGAALGCSRAPVMGAEAPIRPETRIDQPLIDAAIRAEVNYQRCKAGRAVLGGADGLSKVARTHAKWMARAQQMTHTSRTAGQSTVQARLRASGQLRRAGSENIGLLARFRIDGGAFRIKDAAQCRFATQSGADIGPHSYVSLARTIVGLWMASPAHRKNILDPKVTRTGAGIGYDPRAPYCGKFYVAQSFAG